MFNHLIFKIMFEVKVTVDLGEKTVALLTGAIAKASTAEVEQPRVSEDKPGRVKNEPEPTAKAETPKPQPEPAKEEPAPKAEMRRTRRTKEQIAAEEAEASNGWDDMDDDAKLEAIKVEVTKHTKKGKSADIKFMLSNFDAGRASELNPEDYEAFYNAITRYGKGESIADIFPDDSPF
jgi:type IV secretory pathway VirB10-like protein